MAERLKALVRVELDVGLWLHGKLPVEDDRRGDAALRRRRTATFFSPPTSSKAGSTCPAANTMIVLAARPVRAGAAPPAPRARRSRLAARHRLLSHRPAVELGETARSRLQTLERLSGLGAGFTISTRDLDLRGAGELLGEEQAGHLQLVGLSLYDILIERALTVAEASPWRTTGTPRHRARRQRLHPGGLRARPGRAYQSLYSRIDRLRERSSLELLVEEIGDGSERSRPKPRFS